MPILVKNNRPNALKLAAGVNLDKGENEVDGKAWRECLKDPITQNLIGRKAIAVLGVVNDKADEKPKRGRGRKSKPDSGSDSMDPEPAI